MPPSDRVILVLEDMVERTDWLRDQVRRLWSDVHVRQIERVDDFVHEVAACGKFRAAEPMLVILDHDLGGAPTSLEGGTRDVNGETGMNAAQQMRVVRCPVVVWSVNSVRAPEMVDVLQRRGMNARWLPFGRKDGSLLVAIERAYAAE